MAARCVRVYVPLRSSHELVTKWQKCRLWLTVVSLFNGDLNHHHHHSLRKYCGKHCTMIYYCDIPQWYITVIYYSGILLWYTIVIYYCATNIIIYVCLSLSLSMSVCLSVCLLFVCVWFDENMIKLRLWDLAACLLLLRLY